MVSTRRSAEKNGTALRAEAVARQQRQSQRQSQRQQRQTRGQTRGQTGQASTSISTSMPTSTAGAGLPGMLEEMLMEAGVGRRAFRSGLNQTPFAGGSRPGAPLTEPPAKRLKRPGERSERVRVAMAASPERQDEEDEEAEEEAEKEEKEEKEEDEDDEFEDIAIPEPVIQTAEMDSSDDDVEEEEEDSDEETAQVVLSSGMSSSMGFPGERPDESSQPPMSLELNLTAQEDLLATDEQARPLAPKGQRATAAARGKKRKTKKPLNKAERMMRLDVHKVHLMCLLTHAARRNRWCNSAAVQAALRPLLTDKILTYLCPSTSLSQFGRTESLKNGLQQLASVFRSRFVITERGLRRALWDAPEEGGGEGGEGGGEKGQVKEAAEEMDPDAETVHDLDDFLQAAKTLRGSRDVGAQLFCALLRAAGLATRLVCSLQPLSFLPSAPTRPPRAKQQQVQRRKQKQRQRQNQIPKIYQSSASAEPPASSSYTSPLRRLGHPQAADYNMPVVASSPRQKASSSASASASMARPIRGESAFPVYWVEVLDVAHQKWQPVDPLVTYTQWRPAKLEPPASDRANQLSYVIGLAADRSAKDVTRRYAKAFNAKTRRTRVDGPMAGSLPSSSAASARLAAAVAAADSMVSNALANTTAGHKWLRRVLRHYKRRRRRPADYDSEDDQDDQDDNDDVDAIENAELQALEAREPMPRNVSDFQNHPVYALARHLRRHEVLVSETTAIGTVSAGSRAPTERIYRRRDVRLAYTADRWYRAGRVVLPSEIPVKWLPKPKSREEDEEATRKRAGEGEDDLFGADPTQSHPRRPLSPNGVPAYTPEQTTLYRAPPVVNGRIPKNEYGNIDVYVPSMLPPGGVHILDDNTARAAFILGVDYAPALTGFRFDNPRMEGGGGGSGGGGGGSRRGFRGGFAGGAGGGAGGGSRRRGTAVLQGAVVAAEHAEAVYAALAGLADLEEEAEEERRRRRALRVWAGFLRGLRIRERIRVAALDRGEYVEEEEPLEEEEDAASNVTEEYDMVMDEEDGENEGGGFLVE